MQDDSFEKSLEKHLKDQDFAVEFYRELFRGRLATDLRLAREKRGLTQADLAKKIGTTQSVVARMENPDYGRFSLTTLFKIAAAMELDLRIEFSERKRSSTSRKKKAL